MSVLFRLNNFITYWAYKNTCPQNKQTSTNKNQLKDSSIINILMQVDNTYYLSEDEYGLKASEEKKGQISMQNIKNSLVFVTKTLPR